MEAMHPDVVTEIYVFEHNGYITKIVLRSKNEPFLYFYVFDLEGNLAGGMNYAYFSDVTKEDLKDLSIAVPKIKQCIDTMDESHKLYEERIVKKREEVNWTGQKFQRNDFVHFKGNSKYKPCNTYVWTHFGHLSLSFYLIEHEDGEERDRWLSQPPFEDMDGFESVHSSQLREGNKYIQIDCSDDFQDETDELTLIKRNH